jgi:hypothetical protein
MQEWGHSKDMNMSAAIVWLLRRLFNVVRVWRSAELRSL